MSQAITNQLNEALEHALFSEEERSFLREFLGHVKNDSVLEVAVMEFLGYKNA